MNKSEQMFNIGNFLNDTIPLDRYDTFTRAQKLTFSQLYNTTQHTRFLVTERPQLQHREVKRYTTLEHTKTQFTPLTVVKLDIKADKTACV